MVEKEKTNPIYIKRCKIRGGISLFIEKKDKNNKEDENNKEDKNDIRNNIDLDQANNKYSL